MDCDKVTFSGGAVQLLATFSFSIIACLSGLLFSWPSYNVTNFVANETVLSEPMTLAQKTLLGSLPSVGALLSTPVCGIAVNKIGRKYTSMMIGLPFIIAWTILTITNSVTWVLVAMAIGGCGVGGQAANCIYIAEIAQDSIRGALVSSVVSVYYLGLLASYFLGGYLTYTQIIYVQLSVSVLYISMVYFMKESPVYLLQIGREQEAEKALAFYRQTNISSKQVGCEIAKIKLQLDSNLEKMLEDDGDLTAINDLISTREPAKKLSEWQFLKQSQSSKRALVTGVMMMAIMFLIGNIPMQVFAETLFQESVPSLDSNKCSILLAVDLLVSGLICGLLIDRLGRRCLTIYTCTGAAICTFILGLQVQYYWAPEWFTALLIYLYNFIVNLGIGVIPYVLIGELFLPEVRGLCGSIVMSSGWALNFLNLLVFTPAVEEFGFTTVFYGFTVIGFAGAFYCVFYQPETKGLSVDLIQRLFMEKPKRKLSDANSLCLDIKYYDVPTEPVDANRTAHFYWPHP